MAKAQTTTAARTAANVQLMHRMYEVRDTAKLLYGFSYPKKIAEAQELIRRAPCEPIRFLPWMVGKLAEDGETMTPGDVMLFTAAVVEMVESE